MPRPSEDRGAGLNKEGAAVSADASVFADVRGASIPLVPDGDWAVVLKAIRAAKLDEATLLAGIAS